jgi:hypothetical protein
MPPALLASSALMDPKQLPIDQRYARKRAVLKYS